MSHRAGLALFATMTLVVALAFALGLRSRQTSAAAPPRASEEPPAPSVSASASAAPTVETTRPPAFREPAFPFLDDEDPRASVSVGDTSDGFVVNARAVTESPSLAILPRQAARDLGYGTAELVALLEGTARRYHEKTGRKLFLGNVGRRGGGDIPWSVSHNAGRDVDVAFAYLDAKGQPVDPPDLVPLDARGVSRDGALRLDVERTFRVVQALFAEPSAVVQYVFVSAPIKRKLLEEGKRLGERPGVLERMDAVLKQPAGAPHDDHLHVRIYCSRRDVEGGCRNGGPVHAGVDTFEWARRARVEHAQKKLSAPSAELRAKAIERLALLSAEGAVPHVLGRLADEAPDVRRAAAMALGALGREPEAKKLAEASRGERAPEVLTAMMLALGALGGDDAGLAIARVLEIAAAYHGGAPPSPSPSDGSAGQRLEPAREVVLAALESAPRAGSLRVLRPLYRLAVARDAELALGARVALARLLNLAVDATHEPWGPEGRAAIARLSTQVEPLVRHGRASFVERGMREAGFEVRRVDATFAWELVRALGGPPHVAWNAERSLERIAELRTPRGRDADPSGRAACRFWLKVLSSKREELRLSRAPQKTLSACAK
jgi:penicillin-insensitive murein endopeptidase